MVCHRPAPLCLGNSTLHSKAVPPSAYSKAPTLDLDPEKYTASLDLGDLWVAFRGSKLCYSKLPAGLSDRMLPFQFQRGIGCQETLGWEYNNIVLISNLNFLL